MRTIKFRGKCVADSKYAGEWVFGGYSQSESERDETEGLITAYLGGNCSLKYHVESSTVGQFTGLYDWCGNEIYEGDILESLDFDKENKFVVEWNQVLAQFQGRWLHQPAIACDIYSMCHGGNYGVCGNIHDNPELLK